MIFLGYVLGLLIGMCLGMMGAGGAILTIPVLTYFFDINPILSTTYSLFIVGITAFIGSVGYVRNSFYDLKSAFFFGVPSTLAVVLTGKFLFPAVPASMDVAGLVIGKDLLIMILFGVLMLLSAVAMIRSSRGAIRKDAFSETHRFRYGLILLIALGVGMVTAFLGAGGGFLIIPSLVILGNLPMKKAVGTSLLLITVNSLLGFVSKSSVLDADLDWGFLLSFSALTAVGILSGVRLARFISGERLKLYFGYFVLVLGLIVLGQELFIH